MSEREIENEIVAKGKTAPRITPEQIDALISGEFYVQQSGDFTTVATKEQATALDCLTVCVLVLVNGFTVVGKSACASPENFDAELGRKIAKDDARRQIWPLAGYNLRCSLMDNVPAE